MMLPTIHSNGTSAEALLDDQREILNCLTKADVALCRFGPNGRDYYPQGDGALEEAVKEHEARIQKVRSVIDEIQKIAEHVVGFVK